MAHCSPVSVPTSLISREVSAPTNSEQSSEFEYRSDDQFTMSPLISPAPGPYSSIDVDMTAIIVCSLGIPTVKTLSAISNNEYIKNRRAEGLILGADSVQKPYLKKAEPILRRLRKGIFKREMKELEQLLTIQCWAPFKVEIPSDTPNTHRTFVYSLVPQHYRALNAWMFRLGLVAKDGFLVDPGNLLPCWGRELPGSSG